MSRPIGRFLVIFSLLACVGHAHADPVAFDARTARSGAWSDPATWANARAPKAGDRVQVQPGHVVTYDVSSDVALRMVHVGGTLTFSREKNTRLDVALLKVQPGEACSEDGFACAAHATPAVDKAAAHNPAGDAETSGAGPLPAVLEIGTDQAPIPANVTATIRLVHFDGANVDTLPAIIVCGGRWDVHGSALSRTWLKLGKPAHKGEAQVTLDEAVTGWRARDQIILTATTRQNKQEKTFRPSTRDNTQTEQRTIRQIDGAQLTIDRPLEFDHVCDGVYRGDVANLSRNVVIESADPDKARGHTMFHRNSTGSLAYAELRHLGKTGVLGKYPIHFHLAGDTMRGSSVVGCSITDSGNRWLTIHGTDALLVRDCIGYGSVGHGFFLEDGTETRNVLDRNLAVQAYIGKPLPEQVFPFDKNDGAGFWWANSFNTFTRNTSAECDEYGYFFQVAKADGFDPTLSVRQSDGTRKAVDVRTLPFVRFEQNESHCQRRHAFNFGGAPPEQRATPDHTVNGVGPDEHHPFMIRGMRIWNTHWAFHPVAPSVLVDGMDIHHSEYGVWFPMYVRHAYRGLTLEDIKVSPEFNPSGAKPQPADFPKPLEPVDDVPPGTMITSIAKMQDGKLHVRGVSSDDGAIKRIVVNGREAKLVAGTPVMDWEITLDATVPGEVTAFAEDATGNVERTPHVVRVR